jgi:hypothetical protein
MKNKELVKLDPMLLYGCKRTTMQEENLQHQVEWGN